MITLGFFEKIDNHPKVVFRPGAANLEATPASSIVMVPFEINDIELYEKHHAILGVIVYSLKEFIIVSKCGVKYALADFALSKQLQKAADNYLYDTKVLAMIESEDEIGKIAAEGIDGVINRTILE